MVKKAKVLLVDDELPSLSKMYIDLLLKNYEVEATHEAGEVMARLRRFRPDVVIISQSLPRLDCHELCCASKEQGFALIVLVSEEQKVPCRIGNCSAAAVLRRPVDLCRLQQAIGDAVMTGALDLKGEV